MNTNFQKRVLFIGMPDMALVCLSKLVSEGFNIVGVVPPHKTESTYGLMCNFVRSLRLPLYEYENRLDEIDFIHKIRQLEADIAVVCSYNKKFPIELLKSVKHGFVNCHPSLLPDYRGANPYSNVLINGEQETGVTLHFMDENFDTGNIIAQKKVSIEKNETMGTLFNRMNFICADMIADFLKQFELSTDIQSVPQPVGEFKKAPAIDPKNMKNFIDWTKDARDIEPVAWSGGKQAGLALDVYHYLVACYIARCVVAMNGVDVITFTAGTGERGNETREILCDKLKFLGVELDKEANKVKAEERKISSENSKVLVYVVPTEEELMIARETKELIENK